MSKPIPIAKSSAMIFLNMEQNHGSIDLFISICSINSLAWCCPRVSVKMLIFKLQTREVVHPPTCC